MSWVQPGRALVVEVSERALLEILLAKSFWVEPEVAFVDEVFGCFEDGLYERRVGGLGSRRHSVYLPLASKRSAASLDPVRLQPAIMKRFNDPFHAARSAPSR